MARVAGAELPQETAHVVAGTALGSHAPHAHQAVVGPRLAAARLALSEARRPALGGGDVAAQQQAHTARGDAHYSTSAVPSGPG
jgi:hypothetical protein